MTLQDWRSLASSSHDAPFYQLLVIELRLEPRKPAESHEYLRSLSCDQEDGADGAISSQVRL